MHISRNEMSYNAQSAWYYFLYEDECIAIFSHMYRVTLIGLEKQNFFSNRLPAPKIALFVTATLCWYFTLACIKQAKRRRFRRICGKIIGNLFWSHNKDETNKGRSWIWKLKYKRHSTWKMKNYTATKSLNEFWHSCSWIFQFCHPDISPKWGSEWDICEQAETSYSHGHSAQNIRAAL